MPSLRNTTAKVAAVACVLLQSLAPGVLAGDPVATGALPRLQHGGDSGLSQEFHRHLMSFDVSAGVKGSGCGGNFQQCCPEDTCGEPTLTCVQSTTCLKCGTSGRHVCTAEGTEPCGAGLVDRQGICFTDFGISFGGSGPGAPPPLGSYGGPPPAPAPNPDPEPEPVPGEDGTGGEDCGVGFAPCCDGSCNDGLVCRFGEICVECGAFAQTACDGDKPCDDGLTAFNDVCLQDTGKGGPSPSPEDPSDDSGDGDGDTNKSGGAIVTTSGNKGSFTSITKIPSAHKKADKSEAELRAWG